MFTSGITLGLDVMKMSDKYAYLKIKERIEGNGGEATVTYKELSNDFGCSLMTAMFICKRLQSMGLIRVVSGGQRIGYTYRLND